MTADQSFGAWLLAQTDRRDSIGDLARDMGRDAAFPRNATPVAARYYLQRIGAAGAAMDTLTRAVEAWALQ